MCEGEESCIQGFLWGKLSERDHLEDLGTDGRILLKWIFKDGMERHGLVQDSYEWWAFENVVMNFRVSLNVENLFTI